MKNLNDKLSEALDIEPLIVDSNFQQTDIVEVLPKEVTTTNNVVEDDAEFARRNLKSLIEKFINLLYNLIKMENLKENLVLLKNIV